MGETYVGLADDWTAVYWNPAGLTLLEGEAIGLAFPKFEMYELGSQLRKSSNSAPANVAEGSLENFKTKNP